MKRRWFFAVFLLLVMPLTSVAAENGGYIRLTMAYNGQTVTGGSVTLYDVSDTPEDIGPPEMILYAKELGIPGTEKKVDTSGQVIFDGLSAGKYLLVQQKAAEGFYPMNPFLIQLPLESDGIQVGCIEAAPKLEPEKKLPQTGQLIWPAWMMLSLGIAFAGIGIFSWNRE